MAPINGVWSNPAERRCNRKAAYPSMSLAEQKAETASSRTGSLIIGYQCYDCGKFHIGHADESQRIARQESIDTPAPAKCILCGSPMNVKTDVFNPNPAGPSCGTKRCKRRRQRRRQVAKRKAGREESQSGPEPGGGK
jgi:hypothetical protein